MTRLSFVRLLAAAAMVALAPVAANAGQCPAGKTGVDVRPMDPSSASKVTDTVLTTIDVASEPSAIPGRSFRLRKLVVQPGGVVPWHSHGDRPAIIHVVSGEITEFASTCSVPIVHRAGDTTPELHATSHWWKNEGEVPAVLLSSDLLKTGGDAKMM
ncbi:MAG: cupin domain-containing protein [Sandarakinorhabdus sp.]|nr:cupin domain-containing protein [Sandarakinorhabdus sp.]